MVNVSIFIEGGVLPNDKISVQTIDNSEKLRESFYSILSQIISPNDFNISIKQGSSNNKTVQFFKSKIQKDQNSLLLIDLDRAKDEKIIRLTDYDLVDYSDNVFFMVQEMEAWIISQIDKVDLHYKDKYTRKRGDFRLSEHGKIKNLHPENIVKPSIVLKEILGKYFSYKHKRNKNKKYNKLRDGADLLFILDANELQGTFTDFKNLIMKIKQ